MLQGAVDIDSPRHDPPNFSSTIFDRMLVWFPPPHDLEQSPEIHWLHSQSTDNENKFGKIRIINSNEWKEDELNDHFFIKFIFLPSFTWTFLRVTFFFHICIACTYSSKVLVFYFFTVIYSLSSATRCTTISNIPFFPFAIDLRIMEKTVLCDFLQNKIELLKYSHFYVYRLDNVLYLGILEHYNFLSQWTIQDNHPHHVQHQWLVYESLFVFPLHMFWNILQSPTHPIHNELFHFVRKMSYKISKFNKC